MAARKSSKKQPKNWFHEITEKHKKIMERGEMVWRKPFKAVGGFRNTTGTVYHGVNVLHLFMDCILHGFTTSMFITTSELRKRHIKFSHLSGQGKHSTILRWVPTKYYRKAHDPENGDVLIDEETGKEKYEEAQMMVLKYVGTVWNIELFPELMEEYDTPEAVAEDGNGRFDHIEELIEQYFATENAPGLTHLPGRACYHGRDKHSVNQPAIDQFGTSEEYYDTFFHEMGHSTGHKNLLARRSLMAWSKHGDKTYSQEELVAEFTACFLCADYNIDRPEIIENSAAYLQGWWKALDNDEGMMARAICNAQKAYFLITGQMEELEEKAVA